MVSTVPNRQKFIKSLIKYMQKYSLDGLDLGKFSITVEDSISLNGLEIVLLAGK
jgi:chitinase